LGGEFLTGFIFLLNPVDDIDFIGSKSFLAGKDQRADGTSFPYGAQFFLFVLPGCNHPREHIAEPF
jgi:hypothetical protein